MAVLELAEHLEAFRRHPRASTTFRFRSKPGEVVGLMGDNGAGKSTLVKMIAGNFRPSHGTMQHGRAGPDACTGRSKPASTASRSSIRTWRSATISPPPPMSSWAASSARGFGPFGILDYATDVQARRRDLQGTEVRDAAARSRQADVGRPAPGGGDRPHHAVRGQDRADGRADGGDLRPPGRRGAEPHPPTARPGHRRRADQPPHAGRLRGRRPRRSSCGAAARSPTSRSPRARPRKSPASITGAIEQV